MRVLSLLLARQRGTCMDDSSTTHASLTRLEESLWRTETRFDIELMDRTLAADFVEFGRSGRRYDREGVLRAE